MKVIFSVAYILLLFSCVEKKPELELSTYQYDFGQLDRDSICKGSAVIRNTGGADLAIHYIDAGCRCTKAWVGRTPIPSGDTTLLSFTYDTRGKQGEQEVFLLITANTDSSVHVMQFKAFVR